MRGEQVRLINEGNENIGLISYEEALRRAQAAGLDLVEVAGQSRPIVCRIMDYGKFLYEEKKQRKESHKKQLQSKIKEIQFHPNVGDHDYQTKLRHVREFLDEGFRVKVSLYFRGREGAHQNIGFEVMQRVIRDVTDLGHAEQPPRLFGRNILMLLCPRPKVKAPAAGAPKPASPPAAPR